LFIGQGRFAEAEKYLSESLVHLEPAVNFTEWLFNFGLRSDAMVARGHYREGLADAEFISGRAYELNHPTAIAVGHMFVTVASFLGGDMPRTIREARAAYEGAERSGDWLQVYHGHGFVAWASSRMGDHVTAAQEMAQSNAVGELLGAHPFLGDWLAAAQVELALNAGEFDRALELAPRSVEFAQAVSGIFAEAWTRRAWAQAIVRAHSTSDREIDAQFAESVRLFESGDAQLEAAHTRVAWGKVLVHRDDSVNRLQAREHFEKAASQFEASGLTRELEQTRALLPAMT
jgi:hypothetical protein